MNIFDALNIFYREDTISDFLVNCFRDSDVFLTRFLKKAGIQVVEDTVFYTDTRVGLGKGIGTPDIIIRGINKHKMKLIIIENKMGAAEGNEQTNRYESKKARELIAKKYEVPLEELDFHFIFLALDTTVKPKNSNFTFLNYQIFLQDEWPLKQETLQFLFKDFEQKLRNFYKPLSAPYEALELHAKMERLQQKICWQTILYEAFSQNKKLILNWDEANGAGRSNFIFLISKGNWTSFEPHHTEGLGQTFNVHFDTYINMLNNGRDSVKEIGIRFESFPYEPHNKINQLPEYQKFMENKRIFGERLFQLAKKKGIITKRKNTKLLTVTIDIQAKTIRETVRNIERQFTAIEGCIDEVISEMKHEQLIK